MDKPTERKGEGASTTGKPVQPGKSTAVAKVEEVKPEVAKVETSKTADVVKPEPVKAEATPPEQPQQVAPKTEEAAPTTMSLADIQEIIQSMATTITEHTQQISELQEALARKRKAVPNGKVQIRDKQTGKVYPSKNNTYQSLLKAGELKSLVEKGIFGKDPAKNNFGWFALQRELPDRFEEIREEKVEETSEEKK